MEPDPNPGYVWCPVCQSNVYDVFEDHFDRHKAMEKGSDLATAAVVLWAVCIVFGAALAFLADKIIKTL